MTILLYHSFPRGAKERLGVQRAIDRGIAQLEMMIDYGFLMTPECLTIPLNPHTINREPPKQIFKQTRACFTLVERRALSTTTGDSNKQLSHFQLFGEFAIGLNPIRARKLGVVPTIYFYTDPGHNITHEILFFLRELRSLAIALARLEAKANIQDRDTLRAEKLDVLGFVLEGDPIIAELIRNVDYKVACESVRLLDTDRRPAWNLADWIGILLNFFQTADSRTSGPLEYYQQREWRITRLFGPQIRCHKLFPTWPDEVLSTVGPFLKELCYRLKFVDSEFFTDDLLADSAILVGTKEQSFFDFVDEVICPFDATDKIEEVLTRCMPSQWIRLDQCFFLETRQNKAQIFIREQDV